MNDTVTIQIRNLAFGGAGVGEVVAQHDGHTDLLGITAFVPYAIIGEYVRARVTERKDRHVQAQLISVEESTQERVTPRCSIFTICGGCELQHIDYEAQLGQKREMIRGALRAARLPTAIIDAVEPVERSESYGFRRRISLHIDSSGNVGFYRNSSRSVVPVSECPVAVPAINELLPNIQEFGRAVEGKISSVLLEADEVGVIAVLKSPYDLSRPAVQTISTAAKKHFPSAIIFSGVQEVDGFGRQILELPITPRGTIKLRVPAGFFSQVNGDINQKLVARAMELAGNVHQQRVLDLYAGAGNFALPFAKAGGRVTAVECDKRLVALGRENATQHGLQRSLEFCELSVEKYLTLTSAVRGKEKSGKDSGVKTAPEKMNTEKIDLIIADPPRSGLGTLLNSLPVADRFLLISCQLPSFVRDIRGLVENGYNVKTIVPFDMFAQTSYVEILALLER